MTPKGHIPAFLTIIILGMVIYFNTFQAAFHYDDSSAFIVNPTDHMVEFSLERILDILRLERPVSHLTFALNYYFGRLEVEGYHAVNITIHVINGILLYLFIYETLSLPLFREKYGQERIGVRLC